MTNKKARTSAYTVMWVVTVFCVLIPFYIGIKFIVGAAIESSLSTGNLESYVLFNRIFYSRNSIFFVDDHTGRVYLHIVDSNKFNEDVLKQLFNTTDVKIGFRLYLGEAKKEIFYNKDFYEYAIVRYKKSKDYGAITQDVLVTVLYDDKHIEKDKLSVIAVFEVE